MADETQIGVEFYADLSNLISGLGDGVSELKSSTDDMKDAIASLAESAQAGFEKLSSESKRAATETDESMKKMAEAVKHVIEVLGVLEGIHLAVDFVKEGAEIGEQLVLMSQRTGIAVEQLSRLKFAAESSGLSLDDVGMAVQRLDMRMAMLAQTGTGGTGKALADLHIDQVAFQAADATTKFEMLGDAVNKFGSSSRVIGDLSEVIGRGGARMIPMITHMRELQTESDRLGATLKGETAAGAASFEESLKQLNSQWDALKVSITAALAGPLRGLVIVMQDIVRELITWAQNGQLETWGKSAATAVINFAETAVTALAKVYAALSGIGTAIGKIEDAWKFIDQVDYGATAKDVPGGVGKSFMGPITAGEKDTTGSVEDSLHSFFENLKTEVNKASSGAGTEGFKGGADQGPRAPTAAALAAARKAQQEAFAEYTEEQKLEAAEAGNTTASKIAAYESIRAEASEVYGEGSKQARAAALEEQDALNAQAKEVKAMAVEQTADIVREQAAQFEVTRANLQRELAEHQITKSQEKALEDQLDASIIQAKIDEFAKDRALYAEGTKEYEKYTSDIKELTSQLQATQIKAGTQTIIDNQNAATQSVQAWRTAMSGISGSIDQMVNGVLQGTQTIKQLFARMAVDIALSLAKTGIKDFMTGTSAAPGSGQQGGGFLSSGGMAGMLSKGLQPELAKMLTMTRQWTGQFVQTISQISPSFGGLIHGIVSLFGLIAPAAQTASTSAVATTIAGNVTQATSAAALAGANMNATFSNAPWPIDMGAPGAAAGAYATGLGYAVLAGAESGMLVGNENPIVQLHKKEMVLPARLSEGVQNLISNGDGGGDTHIHMHTAIHTIDSQSFADHLSEHSEHMAHLVRDRLERHGQRFRSNMSHR